MASDLVEILADFNTQLFSGVSVGGVTATIVSDTDDDEVDLPDGYYGFTIDGDNSSKEYIKCLKTGTSLSEIKSVTRQGVETTGFVRAHRRGATVTVTDWIALGKHQDLLDGTTPFNANVPLKYDADADILENADFATKKYVDEAISSIVVIPSVDYTSEATTGIVQDTDLTWQHTCSGNNRLLLVSVCTEEVETITDITFNGVSLTLEKAHTRVTGNLRTEIWSLVAPDTGEHDIVVTMSGAAYITAGGVSYNNVDQTTPVDAVGTGSDGSSTAPSDAITTVSDKSVIQDLLGTANDPSVYTPTLPQILQWSIVDTATRQGGSSIQLADTAGGFTSAYTLSPTGVWSMVSVAIKGAENEAAGGSKVKVTSADTTANYLDNKQEFNGPDGTVIVDKTIQNPGANEKAVYDFTVPFSPSQGSGGTKLVIDTTQASTNSQVYTALYTIPIPGGILGTNNAFRWEIPLSDLVIDAGEALYVKVSYGATEIVPEFIFEGDPVNDNNAPGKIYGIIVADNATSAQKGMAAVHAGISTGNDVKSNIVTGYGTATEDSTVSQDLVIEVRFNASGNLITAEGIIIEEISDAGQINKVGVGRISDFEWFNIQLPFSMVNTTDPAGNVWDLTNATGVNPSLTRFNTGEYMETNSDQDGLLPWFDPGNDALNYSFDTPKQVYFQCTAYVQVAAASNKGGIGFYAKGGASMRAQQGTNTKGVGFVRSTAGQLYGRCATGAGFTETSLGTITDDAAHTFRCEYDPGNATPQARFFVDGVLLAVITTNVPNAVTDVVVWGAGNANTEFAFKGVTCPAFAVEI